MVRLAHSCSCKGIVIYSLRLSISWNLREKVSRLCTWQAAQRGTWTARLAHSCSPSCKAVTLVADGRLTLGIYTVRDVKQVPQILHACSS